MTFAHKSEVKAHVRSVHPGEIGAPGGSVASIDRIDADMFSRSTDSTPSGAPTSTVVDDLISGMFAAPLVSLIFSPVYSIKKWNQSLLVEQN